MFDLLNSILPFSEWRCYLWDGHSQVIMADVFRGRDIVVCEKCYRLQKRKQWRNAGVLRIGFLKPRRSWK